MRIWTWAKATPGILTERTALEDMGSIEIIWRVVEK